MTRKLPWTANSQDREHPSILPVDHATVPYWRTELHELDEYRSTEQIPSECDIVIIGAGLSGVSLAYHLLQIAGQANRPSITLLEARQVCSGATGRNGGHVKMRTISTQSQKRRHGIDAAEEVAAFVSDTIYALKNVVEVEGLDCEFELRRSFDVFVDQEENDNAKKAFSASLKANERWTRYIDSVPFDRVEQVTSIRGAKGALSTEACSLWPYKFVTQLLARIIKDVNLQTNTPVTRISTEEVDDRQIVHTSRGTIKAKKVVFATNGYTGGISPLYRDKIVPVRITASHLTPHPQPIAPHLSNTYNLIYARNKVDYLNPRPDGGIVVGGGKWEYLKRVKREEWFNNWDDSKLLPGAGEHFDTLMQRYFKGWGDSGSSMDSLWTGIIGYTADESPHIGRVPGAEDKQYIMAGFNGGGNALVYLSALGLARMILDDVPFSKTGIPRIFETTLQRLKAKYDEPPEDRT